MVLPLPFDTYDILRVGAWFSHWDSLEAVDDIPGTGVKWAFPDQPGTPGKPMLPVASLLAPGPAPAPRSVVGVLQLSLLDAEFSCWGGGPPGPKGLGDGCSAAWVPSRQLRGLNPTFLRCSLYKRCFSGSLFCLTKEESRSGSPSYYSFWC